MHEARRLARQRPVGLASSPHLDRCHPRGRCGLKLVTWFGSSPADPDCTMPCDPRCGRVPRAWPSGALLSDGHTEETRDGPPRRGDGQNMVWSLAGPLAGSSGARPSARPRRPGRSGRCRGIQPPGAADPSRWAATNRPGACPGHSTGNRADVAGDLRRWMSRGRHGSQDAGRAACNIRCACCRSGSRSWPAADWRVLRSTERLGR